MGSLSGKILGNRYTLLEKIGEGGMALVYKAKCQLLNRFVAIKILRPEFTADEEFIKKFKRESLAVASLSHSNIVGIYDVGEQDGIYYIVMEYIAGQTLKAYIKQRGKLHYKEALNICYQIASALEHAHKNGVVHRDIKPHNILITEDKIVKVTDFGIARAATSATVTNTEQVMGSVHYFSPEQARGGYSDHRTDIYSLGVVMYEMLTGVLPYDAESPISIALKHIQEPFEEPSKIDASIPYGVNDIVVKSMEKDMTKRYQSSRELLNDIIKVQQNPNASLKSNDYDMDSTRVISIEDIDNEMSKDTNKKSEVKRGKKVNKKLIIIITAIAMLIFIAVSYFAYEKFFIVKDVKVPAIIGFNVEDGRKTLERKKLSLKVAQEINSDKPKGEILKVDPDVGTVVKENGVINVTISAGQKKIKIPDLYESDLEKAKSMLESAGFKLGTQERRNSQDVSKNLVIEQYPKPGEEVDPETTVNIVVSDGPAIENTTVPVLTGKTLEEATEALKIKKLTLGKTKTATDNRYVDGVVIDQDVTAGIRVQQWTPVNITINKIDTSTDGGQDQNNQNDPNNNIPVTPPDGQTSNENQ